MEITNTHRGNQSLFSQTTLFVLFNKNTIFPFLQQRIMKVQFVCLLLCLFSAVELSASLDFYLQHVIGLMQPDQCTTVIRERGINHNTPCKDTNTFILANEGKVNAICSRGNGNGKQQDEFSIIECRHDGRSRSPNCIYEGQRYDRRIVVLKCNNREPVDLDSTVQIG